MEKNRSLLNNTIKESVFESHRRRYEFLVEQPEVQEIFSLEELPTDEELETTALAIAKKTDQEKEKAFFFVLLWNIKNELEKSAGEERIK